MTRGHFRAFLSLACGILQVENSFEICPVSNTFFCIFAFSSASGEGKKEGANACSLLPPFFCLSLKSNLPALFVFNPGPKAFVARTVETVYVRFIYARKTHVKFYASVEIHLNYTPTFTRDICFHREICDPEFQPVT